MVPSTFGHALKTWRLAQDPKVTQVQIAERCGLTQTNVQRYEAGVEPEAQTVRKLAAGLGVDITFHSSGNVTFQPSSNP